MFSEVILMAWHFFTDRNGHDFILSEHLAIYILSLLDPQSRYNVSLTNKNWYHFVQLTNKYFSLLPTIQSIPMFSQVTIDVLRFKLMTGGMTNATYRLTVNSHYGWPGIDSELINDYQRKKWVVRFPGDVSLFAVERRHEKHNAKLASRMGLNVPMAYFNKKNGVQVTEFIKGVQSIDETMLERDDFLVTLAEKAKLLHTSERFSNDIFVFERNDYLLRSLKEKNFKLVDQVDFISNKMDELERLFSTYAIKMCPCHNDSTPLNYMLAHNKDTEEEKIYQIDWEYSGNNDFLWDLVYFAIEAKLSEKQILTYLTGYFRSDYVNKSVWAWFVAYKPVVEWWITLWSWTQLANEAKAVNSDEYEKLGQERFDRTLMHLNSTAFKEALSIIEADRLSDTVINHRSFEIG